MKRITQDEFTTRGGTRHGGRYTYPRAVYANARTKVTITCPVHGDFQQTPDSHLSGRGCSRCAGLAPSNTNEFIAQATIKHSGKCTYPRAVYTNNHTRLTITCPEHGDFQQRPYSHLAGCGCPKCGEESAAASRSSSTAEFVQRATAKHGGKYSYAHAAYAKTHSKVVITCSEHGDFRQTPASHLSGAGCPKCGDAAAASTHTLLQAEFVTRATTQHGGKYEYSHAVCVNGTTKVLITCPTHGDFLQTPSGYLQGHGCPRCSPTVPGSTGEFVAEAAIRHSGKYTYPRTVYVNNKAKTTITCPVHGDFCITPHGHLLGRGCAKCGGSSLGTTAEFIECAIAKHEGKYQYQSVRYHNANTKVIITCPEHGDFQQAPNNHLRGKGCSKCGGRAPSNTEDFITHAATMHGGKYSYAHTVYANAATKLIVTCPKHGDFQQTPNSHLNGRGCPRCRESRGERQIGMLLRVAVMGTGLEIIQEQRIAECKNKRPLPFDFALLERGRVLGLIEYQGGQHYESIGRWGVSQQLSSIQKRDAIKRDYCTTHGIPLLVIPHWDYDKIESLVTEFVSQQQENLLQAA